MSYKISSTVICSLLLFFCLACGQTYETQSIEIAPAGPSLVGIGGWQQLTVTAKFTNAKTKDVTNRVAYKLDVPVGGAPLAPATAITISASGRLQAVDAACTWTAFGTGTSKTYATNPYILTATWDGQTSVAFVSVASSAGCDSPDTPIGGTQPAITYDVPEQYRPFLNAIQTRVK